MEKHTEYTDKERLARLENEVMNVGKSIERVEMKLDFFNKQFMPRHEVEEKFRSRDQDIIEIREMIKDLGASFKEGLERVSSSFEKQLREAKQDKRNAQKLLPTWISTITAIVALIVSITAIL